MAYRAEPIGKLLSKKDAPKGLTSDFQVETVNYGPGGIKSATAKRIKSSAEKKPLSDTQMDKLKDLYVQTKNVQDILNEFKSSNYPTGAVVGRVPKLAAQYMPALGPDWVTFSNKMDNAFNLYRKAITGAQASFQELAYLRPLKIGTTDNHDTLIKKGESEIAENNAQIANSLDFYEAAGSDVAGIQKFFKENSAAESELMKEFNKLKEKAGK